jgi:thioredoxin-related protein
MRFLIGLLFFSVLLSAQMAEVKDFAAAKALAKKEGKVVYVLITSPTCRWCRKFEQSTLRDVNVSRRLSSMAVTIQVTRGSGTYPDALKAPMVPMHYFLAPDERVLVKMPGYWDTEDFMSILDDVERKRK